MAHREIEIKLEVASASRASGRLRALGATLEGRRRFEDNFLLDTPDLGLRRRGALLRVREIGDRAILTYKGKGAVVRGAKVRSEIETEVRDAKALMAILKRLGFTKRFRYQKYRTTFRHDSLLITLDETPIGTYLEIEGPHASLQHFAGELGYGREQFISKTYHELFQSYRRANHSRARDMVFGIKT